MVNTTPQKVVMNEVANFISWTHLKLLSYGELFLYCYTLIPLFNIPSIMLRPDKYNNISSQI